MEDAMTVGQGIELQEMVIGGIEQSQSPDRSVITTEDVYETPDRPTRRRLIFGENMTPEMATQKANPASTPGKRRLEGLFYTPTGKRVRGLDANSNKHLTATGLGGIKQLKVNQQQHSGTSVVSVLMSNRSRAASTPRNYSKKTRKASTPSTAGPRHQRKITEMLGGKANSEETLNSRELSYKEQSVEGIKQTGLVEKTPALVKDADACQGGK